MGDPVDQALGYVRGLTPSRADFTAYPVTLNFHPDIRIGGFSVVDALARDGVYRSQFETRTSNGGLTAHPGGDRWVWESRIFGGAYDGAAPALRPKYGALNHRLDPVGGSRRFGSCHLRLNRHVLTRTTFCYPDSHFQPQDFGIEVAGDLIALADEAGLAVRSPRDPAQRGGTVILDVPNGREVTAELGRRQILVDFRPGAGIRIAPHFYTAESEIHHTIRELADIVHSR